MLDWIVGQLANVRIQCLLLTGSQNVLWKHWCSLLHQSYYSYSYHHQELDMTELMQ